MGFVLELQQPLLGLPVDIHVDEHRAGVVLLAHLQIVQQAAPLQTAGTDGGEVHQADALLLAAQLAADVQVEGQRLLNLRLHERLLDRDPLQFGGEGGVAAVVAPVGIQNAELRLARIATLAAEVAHHLAQVVGIHRQTVPLAIGL